MTRASPVDRIRARLGRSLGREVAEAIPAGYQRVGRVVVVKLPDSLRPQFPAIGSAYAEELRVGAVLRRRGPIAGDWRVPDAELIAGAETETEVLENGVRYRFDARRIMFAAGNRAERARAGALVQPGEIVADLFAGIGYFAIPAAMAGRARRVFACEENPVSYSYLTGNAARNGVAARLVPLLGDNRSSPLPLGEVDRVFLGLLPSALPYVDRALALLPPGGGWMHLHLVVGTREGTDGASERVRASLRAAGGRCETADAREVKAYGPGRLHAVVDVRARRAD